VRDVDEMSAGDVGKEEEGAQKVGNRSHTERDRVHPTVHDPWVKYANEKEGVIRAGRRKADAAASTSAAKDRDGGVSKPFL